MISSIPFHFFPLTPMKHFASLLVLPVMFWHYAPTVYLRPAGNDMEDVRTSLRVERQYRRTASSGMRVSTTGRCMAVQDSSVLFYSRGDYLVCR